jgi:hypothetical protein
MANKKSKNFRYADSEESTPVEKESTVSGEVADEEDVENTKEAGLSNLRKASPGQFGRVNKGGE